jgi:hypothetical protein
MGEKVFEGRENMIRDWNRVMLAIIRALSGASAVEYKRDDGGKVIGLTAEIELQMENAITAKDLVDYDGAVEEAKKQMADLVTKEGEFTSKQRLLIDWISMRNSILRAYTGEMKVGIHRNKNFGNKVVGLSAELDLNFAGPVDTMFTDEEISAIDEAKNKDN